MKYILAKQLKMTSQMDINSTYGARTISDIVNSSTKSNRNVGMRGHETMMHNYKIAHMNSMNSLPNVLQTPAGFQIVDKQQPGSLNSKEKLVSMWLGRQHSQDMQRPILLLPAGMNPNTQMASLPPMPQGTILLHKPPMKPMAAPRNLSRQQEVKQAQAQGTKHSPPYYGGAPNLALKLPFNTVKNMYNSRNIEPAKTKTSKSKSKVDLTYNGLDRAIADEFIKNYTKKDEIILEDVQV